MKKIVLSFVCVLVACYASHAQGVKFESGTWKEILTKAKTENKTIFVDVYTKWCGPCKHVSETVFPQEKLGEYYNSRFINFKIDAESPAGKEFVKTYPVTGYPTFFFIDGNGKVIHKIVGAKDVDGFISEAKMITMYARHGGIDNMMAAIKNGTADKELLYDYYTSANKKSKPEVLNLYLKALPTEELIDENNKLIGEISLYDKELMTRLVDEIVKASNDGRFSDGKYAEKFAFCIVFPIQYDITTFLRKSIQEGNWGWFNELLQLKERFANYGGREYEGGKLLDGDLRIIQGRGLFFATPEYNKLCYWTRNRVNEEEFKNTLVTYMDKLISENPVDSLIKEDQNQILDIIKKEGLKGQMIYFAQHIFEAGNVTAHNIIAWTDYFWKLSPSDKKTKALCSKWINYAYNVNRFNNKVAIPAADLLARIGNFQDAKIILEKAIASQKELKNEDQKVYKPLELKLRDINNGKL
ncbi:MAG: thioredoxin family protein [Porphyromonadaceae bacterium]|uniref:thioredoxin family protein n=1 Tax=uncultured Butyricimonas sp. TaxID=1268785 RepID=UPI002592BD3B|nr:thioredoxin family protein [uncultured Butyricimonas sp.]MBS5625436.1 thioredoxin family protein [Porphyromonadaceae bacterium]